MNTQIPNPMGRGLTDRNQNAINQARTEAREQLMNLLAAEGDYFHPTYLPLRKKYFEAVRRYADLTDQTFEAALASMF
jgi:hypothetical protein